MARAPATIPTITSPNANAITVRRIVRTSMPSARVRPPAWVLRPHLAHAVVRTEPAAVALAGLALVVGQDRLGARLVLADIVVRVVPAAALDAILPGPVL